MFYKNWKPLYDKIAKDFNFQVEKDIQAADILNKILQKKNQCSIKKLEVIIARKDVVIFGAGPSIEQKIIKHKEGLSNKIKIAADGATSALLENDIFPEIIVTDLDGKITDQLEANSIGSIAVIHAHGDNIDKIKEYVPKFSGDIIGTTQNDPRPYKNLQNFGGFTDGDRAVFLADYFLAKNIYLLGFDFDGEIGKYSFSKRENKNRKLEKLKWCKHLIELLKKKNQNIQEL